MKSVLEYFYAWEENSPNNIFLNQPFGDQWESYTWKDVGVMARKAATGIQKLNLPPKSHIGLVSKNCREWVIADLAIMMTGHVSVPLYPTLTAKQISEVLEIGDVAAIFLGKLESWETMKDGIPEEMPKIVFPHYKGCSIIQQGMTWSEFMDNEPMSGQPLPSLKDIWTIVFTSGTTGTPKGVVLTYENLASSEIIVRENNVLNVSTEGDNHFFSYLPMNHVAERIVVEVSCISWGGQISFAENLETFAQNLRDASPTIFFAVPRIWTKFQMGILSKMDQSRLNLLLKIPVIRGLIKKKIKTGLGLHNCRGFLSGAAPMSVAARNWWRSLDINIGDGYGMTENCAICTVLDPMDSKEGTVGKAQPGTEIKIDEESGEICMRSGNVMQGYYKAEELTSQVIRDGWLHTGDQGVIDDEGYLYITGRVKDTFKTAKGQFIVPSPIEFKFGDNLDIEQIAVVGRGMPQPMAMVVLSESGLAKSESELISGMTATLEKVNAQLENYKKVSKIVVCKEAWTVENGLLTPTLKIKRNQVDKTFEAQYQTWADTNKNVIFS